MAPGEVLPMPDRSLVLYDLRQRRCTRRVTLLVGWTSTIHSSDGVDADQGEQQSGFREGDGDSDLTVSSGTAWAQLRSYAVLLEVLKNILTKRFRSDFQILRLTFIF